LNLEYLEGGFEPLLVKNHTGFLPLEGQPPVPVNMGIIPFGAFGNDQKVLELWVGARVALEALARPLTLVQDDTRHQIDANLEAVWSLEGQSQGGA
jgi:hypothetical protein